MDLAFVNSTLALASAPDGVQSSSHVVCFDWATLHALQERGLDASLCSDEITPTLGRRLNDCAFALSQEWYRHHGEDFTQADGVSLGAMYEQMVWFQTLLPAYKYLAAVTALIDRESPAKIWLDHSANRWARQAVERVARVRAIPVERITTATTLHGAAGAASLAPWRPWSLRPIDRIVLQAYNMAAAASRVLRRGKRIKVLASYYPALDVVFEALAADARFEVLFLERPPASVLRRHLTRGNRFLFPRHHDRSQTSRWVREIRARWESARTDQDYQRFYVCDGLDGWPLVASDVARFFEDTLPRLAENAAAYRAALSDQQIDMILLPFDAPPMQRTAVEIGKALGIPSMVLLHGLPGIYNRRDNCCADYFAAWGQGNITIYDSLGCTTDRMQVVGSPTLDKYRTVPRRASDPVKRIVILTNPKDSSSTLSGDDDPERYILSIFEALPASSDFELVVRPHPAELASYYRDLLAPLELPNLTIQAGTPIDVLLAQTDVLITPVSTVALEAMVLGIPVVWFNISKSTYPPPFAAGWFEELSAVEGLRSRLREVIGEGAAPTNNTARILDDFAGPVDGHASGRILAWILSVTSHASSMKERDRSGILAE